MVTSRRETCLMAEIFCAGIVYHGLIDGELRKGSGVCDVTSKDPGKPARWTGLNRLFVCTGTGRGYSSML